MKLQGMYTPFVKQDGVQTQWHTLSLLAAAIGNKMREPQRIDRMIEKLRTIWKMYPDQKLSQLLTNLSRNTPNWPDIFSVEDHLIEKEMNRQLKKSQ